MEQQKVMERPILDIEDKITALQQKSMACQ
jgi:hypothetical protein